VNLLQGTVKRLLPAACLAVTFLQANLCSGQEGMLSSSVFASIWNLPELYTTRESSIIEKFDLVGRYHGQFWSADAEGRSGAGWENRRFYLGVNTALFHNFSLDVQVSITDNFDPVYEGLYDAFLQWEDDAGNFAISAGRLDYVYTGMERSTSSKRIKTMERALLVNQIMPGEVVGIYLKKRQGDFCYQAGLFSGSIEREFTDFSGGYALLLGAGCVLPLFGDTGDLHLEYLYNNGDADNNAFEPYTHIVSLWHEGRKGALGIGIDVSVADGLDEQSDVFGLTVLPTYDLGRDLIIGGDALQLALRYHYASSREEHGLEFNSRYEQPVALGRGDSYNAFYLGLNYLIYHQKLKIMAGAEYFTMAGVGDEQATAAGNTHVEGWNYISGIRLYF
jgi:phosphate-selective porin OprO/OprP